MIAAHQAAPRLSASSPLRHLRGVGPKRAARLATAGVHSVGDLLLHLPIRYEDRRWPTKLSALCGPGRFLLRGRLENLKRVRVRRRNLSLVRGTLADGDEEQLQQMARSLQEWVTGHIKRDDALFSRYLEEGATTSTGC